MKNYEKPVMEMTAFTNEDVITASGNYGLRVFASSKLTGEGENTINF